MVKKKKKKNLRKGVNIKKYRMNSNNLIKMQAIQLKWAEELNSSFSKEGHQNGQKAHEKMLIIGKMQIKTTVRCHLTPVRMAIMKKTREKVLLRMW